MLLPIPAEDDMTETVNHFRRFVFEEFPARGGIIRLESSWQAMLALHDYPANIRQVLGQILAMAALLTASIKLDGKLILQIQGGGPLSLLVVECTSRKTFRAMVKHQEHIDSVPVTELLAGSQIVITLENEKSGERYQGIVQAEGSSIAEVFTNYLLQSDQLESVIVLTADDNCAAGMLLQKMPSGDFDDDDWHRIKLLTATLGENELRQLPHETVLRRLFHEDHVRLFEPELYTFMCSCSYDKVNNMLRILGQQEVAEILREQGSVSVDCEFCGQHYQFDRVDAGQLFAADSMKQPSRSRH
jgi:molecular chaperone Hsp33